MVQIWLREETYRLLAKERVGREPFGSVIERLLAIKGDELACQNG